MSTTLQRPAGRRSLVQLARDEGVSPAAPRRWHGAGVLDPNGVRVHLHCVRIGGRWYVTDADWADFIGRLNPGRTAGTVSPSAAHERAERELDRRGV
jgi:hypothetical protein